MKGVLSNKGFHILMKVSVLFSLVLTLMISVPSITQACSCVEPGSVQAELVRSKIVFAGEVLDVKERKTLRGFITKTVLFDVTDTWKGLTESQVIITTGQGGGDCGYNFQQGEEYLIYANLSSMYGDKEELVSIICSRTNELSAAQEDLAILGQGDKSLKLVNLEREFNGISKYTWALIIVLVGIVGYFIWRRVKLRSR